MQLIDVLDEAVSQTRRWRSQALCAQSDPELFYPDQGGPVAAAKAMCRKCPGRGECLTEAIQRGEPYGIWGGLTARERRERARLAAAC